MTIADAWHKGKAQLGRIPRDALILAVLLLACAASFGLGYRAGLDAGQGSAVAVSASEPSLPEGGQVVASREGSKYFLPWCSGADAISQANKVWFKSAADAEAVGYQPAGNCKGL